MTKNFCIIEDNETYIKYEHQQIPGAVYYISKYRGETDKKFKYIKLDKFSNCSCGKKSVPYICDSTLTDQIYVKDCLQKHLLPLIISHDNGPVLWPNLVSNHYGKLAMECYEKNDLNVVPKTANPLNCPELMKSTGQSLNKKLKKKKKKLQKHQRFENLVEESVK